MGQVQADMAMLNGVRSGKPMMTDKAQSSVMQLMHAKLANFVGVKVNEDGSAKNIYGMSPLDFMMLALRGKPRRTSCLCRH